MNFDGVMRLGSLEITAALFAVAVVASRPRVHGSQEIGQLAPMRVFMRVFELGAQRAYDALCPFVIGRGEEADLIVRDAEVSRKHARLESSGGVVYVRDLESSNGTFLNGRRVRAAIEVRPGDEIDMGTTRLLIDEVKPWT